MTDFIVRFEGVKLSHEATRHIQAAIGAVLETAMGSSSFPNPEGDDICVFTPHRWNGKYVLSKAALLRDPSVLEKPLTIATSGIAQHG